MSNRKTKAGRVLEVVEAAPATQEQAVQQPLVVMTDAFGNAYTEADLAPTPPPARTVVKTAYKHRYQDLAKARGLTDKASRRGNGDWLQRELQSETVVGGVFDLGRFEAILDANGVDYSRWNRTSNGWQGRVRMSGSLVLRGVVGKSGIFRTPESTTNLVELAEQGNADAAEFLSRWAN